MALSDIIIDDVGRVFLNANDFAVSISVNNQDAGTNPRTIKAIVNTVQEYHVREGNTALQYRTKTIEISAKDNVEGVVTPKVRGIVTDAGGMTVTLPGDAATWYVIAPPSTDAGMHTLTIVDNDGV